MAAVPAHVRTIRVDAVQAGDRDGRPRLRVHEVREDHRPRGALHWLHHAGDVIHPLEVTLTDSYPDVVIRAVEGRLDTTPYPNVCPDVVPGLQSLVGVSRARGFTRAVHERIGRSRGCTHVAALILAMGPVVRQGTVAACASFGPPDDALSGDPDSAAARPWFVNSCRARRGAGELHARRVTRPVPGER